MSRILFTMYDVEQEWGMAEFEIDPFAPVKNAGGVVKSKPFTYVDPFASGGGGGAAKSAAAATGGSLRGEIKAGVKALGRGAKRTGQLAIATSKRGLKFLRRIGGRAAGTTGNIASRGVGLVGKGISKAGGLVSRGAGAIGRNPKVAGAVILGGAAVGAGAYAVNRKKERRFSRYQAPATFSRRYR